LANAIGLASAMQSASDEWRYSVARLPALGSTLDRAARTGEDQK